jgi:hypothetical protein
MNQRNEPNRGNGPLRRATGIACLAVGVLGCVLPILPGWPFLVPAVLLLGRRDPLLRHAHLLLRRRLRQLRRVRQPQLRRFGVQLTAEYGRSKRLLTRAITTLEREQW